MLFISPFNQEELTNNSHSHSTGKKYVRTKTSIPTNDVVNVTYGEGFFTGKEYFDQITIAKNFVIKNQSIGDATKFASFEYVLLAFRRG